MKNSEIRKITKEAMKGKMGKALGMAFLYMLITGVIGAVLSFIPFLGPIASMVIGIPLTYGFVKQIVKFANGENVGLVDFFELGFKEFGKVWCCNLWIVLKCLIPIAVLIVGTIFANISFVLFVIFYVVALVLLVGILLRYLMLNYAIAYDGRGLSAKELVTEVEEKHKGKIGSYVAMLLFYVLAIFACALALVLIYVVILTLGSLLPNMISGIIATLGALLMICGCWLLGVYFQVKIITVSNEFYKQRILNEEF